MTRVAIIGSSFGGLAAAVPLKDAGVEDVVVFEKSHDVGGVWRENTAGAATPSACSRRSWWTAAAGCRAG